MTPIIAQTSWLIPLYPLLGALLTIPWSPAFIRRTGPRPAGYINIVMTVTALVHSLLAFLALWGKSSPQFFFAPWLDVAGLSLAIPLEASLITLGACVLIAGLNLMAQIYAVGYLEMDWGWGRFFAMMALFEAGLCALVLCNSLLFAYMLLEILTLGTYLLVGFWYNQSLVVTGARDAFLTKRVGDLVLLMAVLAIYPLAHTWDFRELAAWAQTANVDPGLITLIGIGLIAGPMSKCAQFPLHLWLDEAMEGPLPSTILRNSVVVTTGIWVLVEMEPVIALSPTASAFAIAVGAVTAIGATLISAAQIDIKRVLSYLSSAYMGLMFIALGAHQPGAALLLALIYALGMAALVMGAGSIIINITTQDLTQMGGLWGRRPVTAIAMITGAVSLVALPPLGGFWAMLSLVSGLWHSDRGLLVAIVLLVNWLMAFSLARLLGLIFAGKTQQMTIRSPEPIWFIVLPLAIVAGFALHLPLVMAQFNLLPAWAEVSQDMALLLTWSSILGAAVGTLLYVNRMVEDPSKLIQKPLQNLLAYDFYTPKLYRNTFVLGVDVLSRMTDWLDRYVVDGLVNAVGLASLFSGETLKYGNTGQFQFYVLTIALGVAGLGILMNWQALAALF
ncbi:MULTISPECIES: NAD(P)H-quinone oxidoreductase subunit F [Cyanophyceae]|uniref:NAD(P)H-quinone oxidoreductase subunit F n=1 Tax=Cyanophyceae TaxID=3028117 RepID=UPI00168786A7|nr:MULTISPECIES: NAD(P)H-quinone oxidoreductase subunit F [Cyanophyceae]MBD1916686.1 NAD(P)H-quinone oxidoreductase subunit F [Phormidium sp. FACHB-77]MBD2031756.1 NAD(P)H-quinone oxidoreductase subunit F [Phormidium sp. FACHB-322]MBD2050506.1 NAD(P)H-quinone oxidoreductase subunit F [Leptolyngbya sp. FACHB-60]